MTRAGATSLGASEAGGTGIEPATCGFGGRGAASRPVSCRLILPISRRPLSAAVSSSLSASLGVAVRIAVKSSMAELPTMRDGEGVLPSSLSTRVQFVHKTRGNRRSQCRHVRSRPQTSIGVGVGNGARCTSARQGVVNPLIRSPRRNVCTRLPTSVTVEFQRTCIHTCLPASAVVRSRGCQFGCHVAELPCVLTAAVGYRWTLAGQQW